SLMLASYLLEAAKRRARVQSTAIRNASTTLRIFTRTVPCSPRYFPSQSFIASRKSPRAPQELSSLFCGLNGSGGMPPGAGTGPLSSIVFADGDCKVPVESLTVLDVWPLLNVVVVPGGAVAVFGGETLVMVGVLGWTFHPPSTPTGGGAAGKPSFIASFTGMPSPRAAFSLSSCFSILSSSSSASCREWPKPL